MAFEPPPRLIRALGETAPDGDGWLAELPAAAERAVAGLELTVERVQVPGGRSSLVLLVRRADGTPAVLKLAPPRARPEGGRAALAPYRIDDALLDSAAPGAIALHCLPAHPGEEITAEVLYGPRQRIWDQAENRRHAQKALLELLIE